VPFTPFHMGPALIVKAALGGSFSLTVFGFAQVAMDIQPLVHLLRGEGIVHGISHTYLGAAAIGALSLLLGRPLCQFALNYWKPDPADGMMTWLRGSERISWLAATTAAFLGTFSHVLLDSMVHADVQPFAPFCDSNPLLGLVSLGAAHMLCLGMGVLGVIGLVIALFVDSSG
jgi:hypothetical protein